MSWDKIITGAPVNAQAAKQMGRGEAWAPKVTLVDWRPDCPPLRQGKDLAHVKESPSFVDFTGQTFGRLTVIGLTDEVGEVRWDKKARWAMRCVCGGFVTRSSKSLKLMAKNANNMITECGQCDYLHKLQRGWTPRDKSKDAP